MDDTQRPDLEPVRAETIKTHYGVFNTGTEEIPLVYLRILGDDRSEVLYALHEEQAKALAREILIRTETPSGS